MFDNLGLQMRRLMRFGKLRQDRLQMTGRLVIRLLDKNGQLKDQRIITNLVVNTGLYHIADQLSDQGEGAMSHMAVGTDNTAPAAGNTTLGTESARVALDSTTQGSGASADEVTYVATFPAGTGTGALVEAGIFNAASAGVMLCRSVFSVINKGASDSLEITWVLTISAS